MTPTMTVPMRSSSPVATRSRCVATAATSPVSRSRRLTTFPTRWMCPSCWATSMGMRTWRRGGPTAEATTGVVLPGWPHALPGWPEGFPTVVDVDNDGFQDVCVSTGGGEVRAVSHDGQLIAGYPKTMSAAAISGVAAGDIDGDGLFELVVATWDGWVYAWDTDGEVLPSRADWPMRNVNARNTGVFGDRGDPAGIVAESEPTRPGLRVECSPGFAHAQFRIIAQGRPGVVEIYDSLGRLVDVLPAAGSSRIVWDPRPGTPAGVYLARLRGASPTEAIRVVLVRVSLRDRVAHPVARSERSSVLQRGKGGKEHCCRLPPTLS